MVQQGSIVSLTRGHYRLCAPLGGSAYGIVWRAEAPGGASVALKLVNTEQMARAPSALRGHWIDSARREAAFLAGLAPWDGRHIVRLLDSGSHAGLPAMALELLDGDLAAWLARERACGRTSSPAQALDWCAQVNQALAKVHAAGFRYLDLKPANLLLDCASGALKLADFGTSRPRLEDATHSYAGTASWQAPEQFFPGPDGRYLAGRRSDYFSLGALLYYLVCGSMLRYGAACGEAYGQHGRAGAAALRARHGGLPPVLAADEAQAFAARFGAGAAAAARLLQALLAPRPQDRPGHALDISRMLEAARSAMGGGPTRMAA
jgi:serine/threonine-protein kinase